MFGEVCVQKSPFLLLLHPVGLEPLPWAESGELGWEEEDELGWEEEDELGWGERGGMFLGP